MKRKGLSGLEWIIIAVFLAIALGIIQIPSPTPTPAPQPPAPGPAPAPICMVEDTTLDLNPQDIFAKGTEVDIGTYYWINGEYIGLNEAPTTQVTVSPGDKLVAMATCNGNGTTSPKQDDANIGGLNYYGSKKEFTVPCAGTYQANIYVYKMDNTTTADKGGMFDYNTSATIFNENDQVTSSSSNQWDADTGETYSGQIKIKSNSDRYLSNPESEKGILVCFDAQGQLTNYKEIRVTSHGAVTATVPESILGSADWCWELTEVTHIKDGETIYIDVEAEADSSANPTAVPILWWLVDTNYYRHTDTGELLGPDYEDNDGNQLGMYETATVPTTGYHVGGIDVTD
jgi:hypothetical protein